MNFSRNNTNKTNERSAVDGSKTGNSKKKKRSAKQIERCRKYRERLTNIKQNNTGIHSSDGKKSYTEIGINHSDGKKSYIETGINHSDGKKRYIETGINHSDGKKRYTEIGINHSNGKKSYTEIGINHSDGKKSYTEIDINHSDGKKSYTEIGINYSDEQKNTDIGINPDGIKKNNTETGINSGGGQKNNTDTGIKFGYLKQNITCAGINPGNGRQDYTDLEACDQHDLLQPIVPPFQIQALFIPGATAMHQPFYFFSPGIIPPAHLVRNTNLSPSNAWNEELSPSRQPNIDETRGQASVRVIPRQPIDDSNNEAYSSSNKRQSQDDISDITTAENENIDINSNDTENNHPVPDGITTPDNDDDNKDDCYIFGIMAIYVNSNLHSVLETDANKGNNSREDKDFGYSYFCLENFFK